MKVTHGLQAGAGEEQRSIGAGRWLHVKQRRQQRQATASWKAAETRARQGRTELCHTGERLVSRTRKAEEDAMIKCS